MLTQLQSGLWVATHPQTMFGIHVGTRMTVLRLPGGGLLLHSPIPLTPELREELNALGPVHHIVCPNVYHHLHAKPWAEAYQGATVHAPAQLRVKRPDLRIDRELSESPDPGWAGALEPIPIRGCALFETVLVHPAMRTVISSDLTENFSGSEHLPTKVYLRFAGLHGKPAWPWFLRVLYRDHKAARASIDQLLEREFDRVVLAHGAVIERNGKAAVRQTFSFL